MAAFIPDLSVEATLFEAGAEVVVGLDEVGRGAWAGPVSVGAVAISSLTSQPEGVRDSKALSATARRRLAPLVDDWALSASVGHASHHECDQLGMTLAISLAASRALDALGFIADGAIIDGPVDLLRASDDRLGDLVAGHRWRLQPPRLIEAVIKADQRCATVAAASIVAKVTRDALMAEASASFPPFDFERNVGYPSPVHQRALRGYGLTSIHRRSWSFVESVPWMTSPASDVEASGR